MSVCVWGGMWVWVYGDPCIMYVCVCGGDVGVGIWRPMYNVCLCVWGGCGCGYMETHV